MRQIYTHHHLRQNPLMVLWFMLWYRIPAKSKRLCVLASLYARLTETGPNDQARLEEINRLLGLSRDTNALKFPVAISRWIWNNVHPLKKIDLSHEEHYVSRLVKKTPCWLWYSDAETRHADIKRVVELCKGNREVSMV